MMFFPIPEDVTHVLPGLLVPGHVGKVLAVVSPNSPNPEWGSFQLSTQKIEL